MELKGILRQISRPGRYINQEDGSVHKKWDEVLCRCALCFPDKYEIGMSNMGMEILYFLGNDIPEVAVERCYTPELDLVDLLKKKEEPLFALESKKSLREFDLICFSVQYELAYTNVLLMLDLAKIPLLARDRSETDPLVIIGGHCAFNPEPLGSFVDIAVVGEGEESFPALLKALTDPQVKQMSRSKKLDYLAGKNLPGLYFTHLRNITEKVFIKDLNALNFQRRKIIPYVEVTHERANVEIMRGCLRGCRFCQAGFVMRPQRAKNKATVLSEVECVLAQSGYDEISLLSLTASDHPQIDEIVTALNDKYAGSKVNISLPSLRTDSISDKLLQEIQKVRKTTVTIAPEAGSQRLREIIHKDMTEDDIARAFSLAVNSGARSIKLYFMLGLPGETDNDIIEIPELVKRLLLKTSNTKHPHVTVSLSNFVPKPHTPFQWAGVNSLEEIKRKQKLVLSNSKRSFNVKFHNPETSLLEAIFSRADREVGEKILVAAYHENCIFTAWEENLAFEKWLKIFNDQKIDLSKLLAEVDLEKELPWGKIRTGVPVGYLRREWLRAKALIG